MKVRSHGASDVGKVRQENEDAYWIDESRGIYAVADGLGGLPGGAEASSLAIESLQIYIENAQNGDLQDYHKLFAELHQAVKNKGRTVNREIGIGTTLTVLFMQDDRFTINHVGDCAAFLLRDDAFRQLTIDHTMEQEIRSKLAPGQHANVPEYFAHTLTRCLGQNGEVAPDIVEESLQVDDRILLCTDGVTKVFEDAEINDLLSGHENPIDLVEHLISEGNKRGGPDNSTAIAIYIDADQSASG